MKLQNQKNDLSKTCEIQSNDSKFPNRSFPNGSFPNGDFPNGSFSCLQATCPLLMRFDLYDAILACKRTVQKSHAAIIPQICECTDEKMTIQILQKWKFLVTIFQCRQANLQFIKSKENFQGGMEKGTTSDEMHQFNHSLLGMDLTLSMMLFKNSKDFKRYAPPKLI